MPAQHAAGHGEQPVVAEPAGEQLQRTLAEQWDQLSRTLAEQRDRTLR